MEQPSKEEMEQRLKKARARLEQQQILMKEKKLPVLVLLEGWGAAGKGSVLGKIIKNIDPRFFKVAVMDEPTEEEAVLIPSFCKDTGSGQIRLYGQRMDERSDKGKAARGIIRAGV